MFLSALFDSTSLAVQAAAAGAVVTSAALSVISVVRNRALARRCRDLEARAETCARLAQRRRHQTVTVIAADVAHDLAAPVKYLEDLLKHMAHGLPVEAEDIAIGEEEVARLRRLLSTMRAMEFRGAPGAETCARTAVERALDASIVDWRREARVRLEVPAGLTVRANEDALHLALACFLDNARAAAAGRALGVRARAGSAASDAHLLDVWDEGDGLSEALRDACFRPWSSGRSDGGGFGLALATRIVRSFGWRVAYVRESGTTTFRVEIPPRDIVRAGEDGTGDAIGEGE